MADSKSGQELPSQRWGKWLQKANQQDVSKSALRNLYCDCFVGVAKPHPIWVPEMDSSKSNVRAWMEDLGLDDYDSFHRWTIENRQEFWRQAVERLGVKFARNSRVVLDDSRGIAAATWFPDAQLNIVESCFQADKDSPALIAQRPGQPSRTWSVQELKQNASRVANSLVDAGFTAGDAIGVFMPMTDWSVAIYLGIVMAGCQVVSIADSFAAPEIETRLRISNAKAIFTYDFQRRAGKRLPLFQRLVEASPSPAIVISDGDDLDVELREQDFAWSNFLVDRGEFEPVVAPAEETINVLFSSGTTGEPKAIPWNQLTPIKCAVDGYCHQNIKAGDVCAWPTNLGWMMGPWLIFASLMNRATIALYEDAPMGEGFGQFVQNAQVTMLGVVPTIVKAWQKTGDMEPFDWSHIKVFSSTGESSQVDTMVFLSSLARFKPVIEYCGGTEIGGGYVSSVVEKVNYPAAFNTPAVGLDFVLLESHEGKSHQVCDDGEVFLVPPSIGLSNRLLNRDHFETYYADTPTIAGFEQLRRHGDHFRSIETEDGRLFVAGGRIDDTMNLGGIKVSSAEIERVLNGAEGVLETAAVAAAQADGPDRLIVFAVCDVPVDTSGTQIETLRQVMNTQLKKQLNPLFRVSELRVVGKLPRTASGKVMRRMLRAEDAL